MSYFKALCAAVVLAVAGCLAAAQTTVTNVFDNLNKAIPDGQAIGVSDTEHLTFADPDFASITDLKVTLTISGGYNGDFYAYLVHDGGFSVLLNRVGRTDSSSAGYSDAGMDVTFSVSGYDIHDYQSVSVPLNGDPLIGTWGADGRNVNPASVLDTDAQTSLLGAFNGTNPNGDWTLFLADLDFGDQGTLQKWGVIITAVTEPSTWTLMALGGLAFGMRFLRRSRDSK